MKKVGVITFHAALNYGSMLQAQATQLAIERMGHDCEIIDYRLPVMDRYDRLYCARGHGGLRGKLLRSCYLAQSGARRERVRLFEDYEKRFLRESVRYDSYAALAGAAEAYDVFVSGADQIWSEQVPELRATGGDAILGYFLGFTERKKISYASCIAAMKRENLEKYRPYLERYAALSTREQQGADTLSALLGAPVPVVLDPSMLLSKEDWAPYAGDEPLVKEPYALLYSLRCGAVQRDWMRAIRAFNARHRLKIVVVAPYFELPMPGVQNALASGPREFLNLFANAEVVFTDTFHGTAFAVDFNRPVYTIENKYWKEDVRKSYLLRSLGMADRLIADESDIAAVEDYRYDYSAVNVLLNERREASLAWLRNALD